MIRKLVLAAAVAGLATAAQAQAPAHPPGAHAAPSAEIKARHEAMRKQHMEDLKTVLRLRPDQEAALAAFAAAHEPRTMERRMPEGDGAMTTPQRLDAMAKHEAEMRAEHERMRAALSKFYAALSPDQQKVFDALHRLQGGHGGRMMMMRHGGPMGHGGPGMMMMRRHGPAGGPEDGHDGPH